MNLFQLVIRVISVVFVTCALKSADATTDCSTVYFLNEGFELPAGPLAASSVGPGLDGWERSGSSPFPSTWSRGHRNSTPFEGNQMVVFENKNQKLSRAIDADGHVAMAWSLKYSSIGGTSGVNMSMQPKGTKTSSVLSALHSDANQWRTAKGLYAFSKEAERGRHTLTFEGVEAPSNGGMQIDAVKAGFVNLQIATSGIPDDGVKTNETFMAVVVVKNVGAAVEDVVIRGALGGSVVCEGKGLKVEEGKASNSKCEKDVVVFEKVALECGKTFKAVVPLRSTTCKGGSFLPSVSLAKEAMGPSIHGANYTIKTKHGFFAQISVGFHVIAGCCGNNSTFLHKNETEVVCHGGSCKHSATVNVN